MLHNHTLKNWALQNANENAYCLLIPSIGCFQGCSYGLMDLTAKEE